MVERVPTPETDRGADVAYLRSKGWRCELLDDHCMRPEHRFWNCVNSQWDEGDCDDLDGALAIQRYADAAEVAERLRNKPVMDAALAAREAMRKVPIVRFNEDADPLSCEVYTCPNCGAFSDATCEDGCYVAGIEEALHIVDAALRSAGHLKESTDG